jgi:hypothetical protein
MSTCACATGWDSHFPAQSGRQRPRAIAAERTIHGFQTANKIEHFTPGIRATRRSAKVRATAKRPRVVNQAAPGCAQQGTRAIGPHRQLRATSRPQSLHCQPRLTARQERHPPGKLKLATLRPSLAKSLHRPPGKVGIHRTHFGERGSLVIRGRWTRRHECCPSRPAQVAWQTVKSIPGVSRAAPERPEIAVCNRPQAAILRALFYLSPPTFSLP